MTTDSLRATTTLLLAAVAIALPAVAASWEATAEQRALGFVRTAGSGDAEALIGYILEHFAPDLLAKRSEDGWRQMAEMIAGRHAGLEIVGVEIDAAGHLTVVAESPGGPTLRFGFDFVAAAPDKIAGLSIEAGPGHERPGPPLPPFEAAEGSGPEAVAAALEAWFDDLAERELFSGSALVAWRGEAIFRGAWGLADRRWRIPNRVGTRFDLGSINKSFTRIAVGRLLLEGKLSLDDTIADHLPDYPEAATARKITLRHLLDHSSGLGDIFNERFFRSSRALYRSPRDFFPLFANEPLLFEPGERQQYSNAGFMVLGAVIEAAAGVSYYDFVQQQIFDRAGMSRTGFWAHDEPVPDIAEGYTRRSPAGGEGELRSNRFMLPIRGNSAGSAQSTVDDLLAFDNALRDHELLPPAYTRWYFGGPEPSPGEAGDPKAARADAGTGIAGGAPGVSAVLESDGSITVIVLSNHDEPGAESVARQLRRPLARALAGSGP